MFMCIQYSSLIHVCTCTCIQYSSLICTCTCIQYSSLICTCIQLTVGVSSLSDTSGVPDPKDSSPLSILRDLLPNGVFLLRKKLGGFLKYE